MTDAFMSDEEYNAWMKESLVSVNAIARTMDPRVLVAAKARYEAREAASRALTAEQSAPGSDKPPPEEPEEPERP